MIVPEDKSMPLEFGTTFDTDDVLKLANELFKNGTIETKPGVVDIHELAFEMHIHYTRLAKVLTDSVWLEVQGHSDFYLPPETKKEE